MKKIVSVILATTIALLLLPAAVTATASQYRIDVYVKDNVTVISEIGKDGVYHTIKTMICSTARSGHKTPTGSFRLTAYKSEWTHMLDNTYGRYVSQFSGNYLFHSVCYSEKKISSLITEEYNMLGSPASMGCVRLQVIDAKWIYDNCQAGTPVVIHDGSSGLKKPEKLIHHIGQSMDNGWEPTDPDPNNPWHDIIPLKVSSTLNLRKVELYQYGNVIISSWTTLDKEVEVSLPCGWFMDGQPIEGYQNDACIITNTGRGSQIKINGARLSVGEHTLEFRCNTLELPIANQCSSQATLIVI